MLRFSRGTDERKKRKEMGESSSMQFNVIHHPEALMRKMLIATFAVLAIQLPADWIPGQRKRENRGTKRETVRLFSRRWCWQILT